MNVDGEGKQARTYQRTYQREFLSALLLATLISRVLLLSSPYFADGPSHVNAINRGAFFIQPPGYFLFMLCAHLLKVLGLGAASAVSWLNLGLNLCGVFVFARVCERLFPLWLGRSLSVCYAFMNVIWFSALIHSSYASMTFFGPALYYCLERGCMRWYLRGCAVWAFAVGFRPSDGVFLLPLLILVSKSYSWRERAIGLAIAFAVTLAWWVPAAWHFGGILGPLTASLSQARSVSGDVSPLRVGVTPRSLANIARFVVAVVTSLNILLPFSIIQMMRQQRDSATRMATAWVLPGAIFLMAVYMSDATYIAFMAGGLLLLAGLFLRNLNPRLAIASTAVFLVLSIGDMLLLRPIRPLTLWRRAANSFALEYTAWGVRNRYHKNLSDLQREAGASVDNPFGESH